MEDIRWELKLEPFVLLKTAPVDEEVVQRAVVNEACPQCHTPQLEYHTKWVLETLHLLRLTYHIIFQASLADCMELVVLDGRRDDTLRDSGPRDAAFAPVDVPYHISGECR
ncbi:putative eukaryotic translation initiation factor 6-2 [Iris pallida]|uniref:Eukaryotic translation initiation factor 6-2 n=1 Tax=Iris pallida TaxID=29817 RepID=A0AAX6FZV3_IRIPA|nr:putative eukaryotic translation initiation factor 6-2 [Iris pallida]